MQNIILSPIAKDALISEILDGVKTLLDANKKSSLDEKKNWTAQETADYCKVTKTTIWEWTNRGILQKYKISNRVFYKSSEVKAAIIKIETK